MKNYFTLMVLVFGSGPLLSACGSSGQVGPAAAYSGAGAGPAGSESLHYFDALLGYKNVPKMPIRNIFAQRDTAERTGTDIVKPRPLTAPLVKPAPLSVNRKAEPASLPRLIGIVIREHEAKAFFSGDKFYTVAKGDVVAGRYRITTIQPEKVQVFDKRTGSRRTLRMND